MLSANSTQGTRELTRLLRREDKVASTGQHCPAAGVWRAANAPALRIALRRGEIMPAPEGRPALWLLDTEF